MIRERKVVWPYSPSLGEYAELGSGNRRKLQQRKWRSHRRGWGQNWVFVELEKPSESVWQAASIVSNSAGEQGLQKSCRQALAVVCSS